MRVSRDFLKENSKGWKIDAKWGDLERKQETKEIQESCGEEGEVQREDCSEETNEKLSEGARKGKKQIKTRWRITEIRDQGDEGKSLEMEN